MFTVSLWRNFLCNFSFSSIEIKNRTYKKIKNKSHFLHIFTKHKDTYHDHSEIHVYKWYRYHFYNALKKLHDSPIMCSFYTCGVCCFVALGFILKASFLFSRDLSSGERQRGSRTLSSISWFCMEISLQTTSYIHTLIFCYK